MERPTRRKGPPAKYPWPDWFDGEWHEARYGYEYACLTHSFVTQLHLKARRYGCWVETETYRSDHPNHPETVDCETVKFRFRTYFEDQPVTPNHLNRPGRQVTGDR